MKDKNKIHAVLSMSAYNVNDELIECEDLSHLFNPRTIKVLGKFAVPIAFGVPALMWYCRVPWENVNRYVLELTMDELYCAIENRRTEDGGWAKTTFKGEA